MEFCVVIILYLVVFADIMRHIVLNKAITKGTSLLHPISPFCDVFLFCVQNLILPAHLLSRFLSFLKINYWITVPSYIHI